MFIINFFKNLLFTFKNLQQKQAKIIFLGLDNAGKTTLLRKIKDNRVVQHDPTLTPYQVEVKIGNITFRTTDVGGHKSVRKVWKNYFSNIDGIFFLVDSSETSQELIQTCKEEIHKILKDPMLENVPIAILGNKIDINGAVSQQQLLQQYDIPSNDQFLEDKQDNQSNNVAIFMCSAVKGVGYQSAFEWLDKKIAQQNK